MSDNQIIMSPVVKTALFLIVAVTLVVGFQTWYKTYTPMNMSIIMPEEVVDPINKDVRELNKDITIYTFEYVENAHYRKNYEIVEINFIDSTNVSRQCFIYDEYEGGGIDCNN